MLPCSPVALRGFFLAGRQEGQRGEGPGSTRGAWDHSRQAPGLQGDAGPGDRGGGDTLTSPSSPQFCSRTSHWWNELGARETQPHRAGEGQGAGVRQTDQSHAPGCLYPAPTPRYPLGKRLHFLPQPTYPRAWDFAAFPLNFPTLVGDTADSVSIPDSFFPYLILLLVLEELKPHFLSLLVARNDH